MLLIMVSFILKTIQECQVHSGPQLFNHIAAKYIWLRQPRIPNSKTIEKIVVVRLEKTFI